MVTWVLAHTVVTEPRHPLQRTWHLWIAHRRALRLAKPLSPWWHISRSAVQRAPDESAAPALHHLDPRCIGCEQTTSPTAVAFRLAHAQFSSACGVAALLPAIDTIALHGDSCSAWCSATILTAHSRASGENFGDFLRVPSTSGTFHIVLE